MEIKELRKQNADLLLALRQVATALDTCRAMAESNNDSISYKAATKGLAVMDGIDKAPAANAGGLPSIDALINALPRYKTNRQGLLNQSPTEDGALVFISDLRAALADADRAPAADAGGLDAVKDAAALHNLALVPMHPNREMRDVMADDEWKWEDLLAAAEAVTEDQYAAIAAHPDADRAPATSAAALDPILDIIAWSEGYGEVPEYWRHAIKERTAAANGTAGQEGGA